jgi:succinoglycan biosynthesis protein ExoM
MAREHPSPATAQDMAGVTVCIASIGRPELTRLLRSLEEMQKPVPVRVIVADDSHDGAVQRLVAESAPWTIPIDVCVVGARNIALARNACLVRAEGEFAAFVDDDEWVDENWLAQLRDTALRYKADAVFGAIDAVYAADTPPWLMQADVFRKRPGVTGARLKTGATGNALVRLATVRRLDLRFDAAFGKTGGEDTEFFCSLAAAGGVLVACSEARVYERIPSARLSIEHLRKRYTRGGHTYAHVMLARRGPARRALFYATTLGKLLATGTITLLAWPIRRDLGLRFATRCWGHIGKLRYAADRPSPQLY